MGLEFLSMSVFLTWYTLQPVPQPLPEVRVVPTKQIIQATWIEPVSLRDESSLPTLRKPVETRKKLRLTSKSTAVREQKPRKPLWKAEKSWEFPPILWAGFEGFLAAGLGIVSLIKP